MARRDGSPHHAAAGTRLSPAVHPAVAPYRMCTVALCHLIDGAKPSANQAWDTDTMQQISAIEITEQSGSATIDLPSPRSF